MLRSSTAFFSALLVGIGALGLVIGGLSLANTVAAAVFERIRDFGVKRALGATDLQLGREVLGEALGGDAAGRRAGRRRWPSRSAPAWTAGPRGRASSSSSSRRGCSGARWSSRVLLGRGGGRLRHAPRRAALAGRGDPPRWRLMLRAERL